MRSLIEGMDWAQTPIGPREQWSPTLQTLVQLLLNNRFPMLVWWGPKFCQLYNDAYRPVLGTKHPGSLGQPGSECWKEIWPIIGPLCETPFNGGPSTWVEDLELEIFRHGFTEETHFTVAYSPVPDDTCASGIGGVLATVHDITEKVVAERRVAALRDLAARSSDAKTAAEACANAAHTLRAQAKDIPFAMIYLLSEDGATASLMGATEFQSDAAGSPARIDMRSEAPVWPFREAMDREARQIVGNPGERFRDVPQGPWADPPSSVALIPIPSSTAHKFSGFLIAGISSRLRLDDKYEGFLDLVAAQIGTAVSNARAYESERRRAEELAELDRAKTTFFSNVSHEFRTPLTLALSPLEELLADSDRLEGADIHKLLSMAHRNTLRLEKLVNSLLDFARIEAGRMEASFEPTDLRALTIELASGFRSTFEKAGLEFRVEAEPLSQFVYVDRDMWEKVVLNFLSNAFKFTLKGSVTLGLREKNGCVQLSITDTGVGIPENAVPRIFQRFFRVEGSQGRSMEGTGIGLALVHELVKLHGGETRVESVEGQGSRFTVTLPFGSAHLSPERIRAPRSLAPTSVATGVHVEEALRWLPETKHPESPRPRVSDKPRILLADDNADMREYISRLLSPHYEVEAVSNGQQALTAVVKSPPDLVLSDAMMPELDGFGLVTALRSDARTRTVPIILLSARAGEEARVEGLGIGADDYIVKPFPARELLARITVRLELSRVRRESAEALLRGEEQLQTLIDKAPLGVYLVDSDLRFRQINPAARTAFGNISGLMERSLDDVVHILWPRPYADQFIERIRLTLLTGESHSVPRHIEKRLDGGAVEYYEWRIDQVPLSSGGKGAVCYFRDIREEVQAREAVKALNKELKFDLAAMTRMQQTSMQLIGADELDPALDQILDAAIEVTRADRGNIQLLKDGALRIVRQRGFESAFLNFFATVVPGDALVCGTASGRGRRIVVEDVETHPMFADPEARNMLLAAGVRAVQSTPLMSLSGELLGVLSTHYSEPRRLDGRDIRLLDVLCRQAADLIERHVREEALRRSEERYRALSEQISDGIFIADSQGHYVEVNSSAHSMLGYSREELLERSVPDLLAPGEFEKLPAQFAALASGEILRGDWIFQRKNGTAFIGELVSRMLPDGRYLGILRDISQRKQNEDALRESEERLSLAVEGAGMGTWDVDLNTGRSVWSRRHFEMLGYEPAPGGEATVGMWRARVHPKDLAEVNSSIQEAIGKGSPYSSEHRIVRAGDGEERWLSEFGQCVSNSDGKAVRFVGISFDITKRKTAETKLELSRQTLSELVERAPFGMYIVDSQLRIIEMNTRSKEGAFRNVTPLLGRDLGDAVRILWPEDVAEGIMAAFRKTLDTGQPYYSPAFRSTRHDVDAVESYEWELHRMVLPDGQFGVVSYYFDSTELRNTEAALRESESNFRALANTIPQMAWMTDAAGNFIWFNRRWDEFTGDIRPDSKGSGSEVLHPEHASRVASHFFECIANGREWEDTFPLRSAEGEYRWFLSRALPLRDQAGRITRWFGTNTDISDRLASEQRLRESEGRFRRLYDADIIGIIAGEGDKVLESNDLFLRMLGRQRADLEARTLIWPRFTPPQYRHADERAVQELFDHGQCTPFEKEYIRVDGTTVPVLVGITLLEKNPFRWLAFVLDLTDRKQLEKRLLEKQKLEGIGLLAGGIAHDFNNLLTGVMGNAALLAEIAPAGRIRETAREIVGAGERAAHLIRQMLAYSGKGRFLVEPVDLSDLARSMLTLLKANIPGKVSVRLDLMAGLPPVEADVGQIQQVAMNLVINAAEAIGNAQGLIEITTGARDLTKEEILLMPHADIEPGPFVWLAVSDSGCGMDEPTAARIFDPFFTTKFTGRGLGLAAVWGVVRGHKGAIQVTTAPGKGSRFVVFLPAGAGKVDKPAPVKEERTERHGSEIILVVDDEDLVRNMARRCLEREGYAVLTAESGAAALEVLRQEPAVDSIVLDLSMPAMSGHEALPLIRAIAPGVPVILSSGYSEMEARRVLSGQNISGFLQKPYTTGQLRDCVQAVLSVQPRQT